MGSKTQALKPLMINVGNRHAAMKNNIQETISKRYVVQDSSNLTLLLDRSNSAAAISQAASGSPIPTTNILIENWIARVKCIATSGVWLLFAAIKIRHAKRPIALRKISAVVNLCPIRLILTRIGPPRNSTIATIPWALIPLSINPLGAMARVRLTLEFGHWASVCRPRQQNF
jgi:hypothetical protein